MTNPALEYVEKVKTDFSNIDQTISEFEERKAELEKQIEDGGSDYTLASVKATSTARTELQQIDEALEKAKARRREMTADQSKGIGATIQEIRDEFKKVSQQTYAADVEEIWTLAQTLREKVYKLYAANVSIGGEFRESTDALIPFLDAEGRASLSSHRSSVYVSTSPFVCPYHDPKAHTSPNYGLIYEIYKNCHFYKHEFKED